MVTTQLFKHSALKLFSKLINNCVSDEWYRWIYTMKTAFSNWIWGNMFFVKYFLLQTWLLILPLKYLLKFSVRKIYKPTCFYHHIWQKFNTFSTCYSTLSIQTFNFTKTPALILTNRYPYVSIKLKPLVLYNKKLMVNNSELQFLFPLLTLLHFGACHHIIC